MWYCQPQFVESSTFPSFWSLDVPANEAKYFQIIFRMRFNNISAGGGVESTPLQVFLAIATKINRSTPNFLTFNLYYRDIIWAKIKFITCQGVTWSFFCRKHFVSLHIFHCIFIEFSCSTFSFFWHLYLEPISVFWWKNVLLSFYENIEI